MPRQPVPDIRTLRTICHRGKLSHDRRTWYALQRRISIYLTWLLLHTGLEANHVTSVSVLLALAGSAMLAFRSPVLAVCGAAALVAHHLLDKVDGDIARFRGHHSIVGVYLDELGHGVAFAGIFLGLGLHLAWAAPSPGAAIADLTAGSLGAIAMVMGRAQKSIGFLLYAQHALGHPELIPDQATDPKWAGLSRDAAHRDRGSEAPSAGRPAIAARFRDLALQLSDFSILLVLVLAGAILELLGAGPFLLRGVLYAGAAFHLAMLAALVAVNVAVNVKSEVTRLAALGRDRDDAQPRE
jgi:hypothetical protein